MGESAVTALFDAGRGFGHHSTAVALAWCMERARAGGLAAAAVRHSSHVGRLGDYGERAAEEGLLAIATVGAAGPGVGEVMPFGGRERFLGANQWSFTAPGRTRAMVYDGPTATVSTTDVRLARARGQDLPPDCVYDRYGRPSTDPDDLFAGGGLVPLGGSTAGHRGLGLGLASALFGGLAMIGDGDPSLAGAAAGPDLPGRMAGVLVLVIDPAAFGRPEAYRDLVEGTLAAAKAVRPGPGRSEVLLPGEAEARARADRGRNGVRLPDKPASAISGASRL
jgi:LDH2 family malate/lactate/ureidoglycolate dehydrogenase